MRGKIRAITQMVKENSSEIANIIKSGEQKTIIFSTFAEPLFAVQETLQQQGIRGIVHTGQDDYSQTLEKFRSSDVDVLLATTASLSTGADGMQFLANQIIMLNKSYREVDQAQTNARIHRQGTTASVVKIFFMRLNTDAPNILDSETEIAEWSRKMFKLIID